MSHKITARSPAAMMSQELWEAVLNDLKHLLEQG